MILRAIYVKVIEYVGKQPRARSSFKPRENTQHAEDLIQGLNTRAPREEAP